MSDVDGRPWGTKRRCKCDEQDVSTSDRVGRSKDGWLAVHGLLMCNFYPPRP